MIEPFGDFVVSTSDDFVADLEGISEALNQFTWSSDWVEWGVFDTHWGVKLLPDSGGAGIHPIPTLFPNVVTAVFVERDDGVEVRIENPTAEEVELAHDFLLETAPLKQIAEKVTPRMKTGSFEISCWITELHQGLTLERMRFYSDGRAERSRVVSGLASCYESISENIA